MLKSSPILLDGDLFAPSFDQTGTLTRARTWWAMPSTPVMQLSRLPCRNPRLLTLRRFLPITRLMRSSFAFIFHSRQLRQHLHVVSVTVPLTPIFAGQPPSGLYFLLTVGTDPHYRLNRSTQVFISIIGDNRFTPAFESSGTRPATAKL